MSRFRTTKNKLLSMGLDNKTSLAVDLFLYPSGSLSPGGMTARLAKMDQVLSFYARSYSFCALILEYRYDGIFFINNNIQVSSPY